MIKSAPTKALYADLFKHVILYKNGGVYLDIDVEMYKSISKWEGFPWEGVGLLMGIENLYGDLHYTGMSDQVIIAAPKNPIFIKFLLNTLEIWV